MASLALGVRFTPVSAGTADFVYSGTVTGYTNPTGLTDGHTYRYRAESGDLSQWEWGSGTWTAGTSTLARTTPLLTSTGSKVSFTAQPQVSIVIFPADVLAFDDAMSLTAAQQAQAKTNLGVGALGQCVLALSGSNLALTPLNGNLLTINGVQCTVPDAGVTLAPTSLTASTLYYIYATQSAGVVNALVASTTGHSVSTTAGNKGVVIQTGDDTKTLVGAAYVVTGPAFADTQAQRLVRSWFNRRPVALSGTTLTSNSSLLTSSAEISSTLRVSFLQFANEVADFQFVASYFGPTLSEVSYLINYDGSISGNPASVNNDASSRVLPLCAFDIRSSLSEGFHYATAFGVIGVSSAVDAVAGSYVQGKIG